MACRLIGVKLLPEPMMIYCQLDAWERISVNLNKKETCFCQENHFENVVCNMTVILFRFHITVTHNERDGVSNNRCLDRLLNRLFKRR